MIAESQLLDLLHAALTTIALVGGPFVVAALVVGVAVALLQAATQLQEATLSFVPKVVIVGMVLALAGPWVLGRLVHYTTASYELVARVGQGGGALVK